MKNHKTKWTKLQGKWEEVVHSAGESKVECLLKSSNKSNDEKFETIPSLKSPNSSNELKSFLSLMRKKKHFYYENLGKSTREMDKLWRRLQIGDGRLMREMIPTNWRTSVRCTFRKAQNSSHRRAQNRTGFYVIAKTNCWIIITHSFHEQFFKRNRNWLLGERAEITRWSMTTTTTPFSPTLDIIYLSSDKEALKLLLESSQLSWLHTEWLAKLLEKKSDFGK